MKRIHLFALTILTGILLSIAWPARGLSVLLFIGFVPLLIAEDFVSKNKHRFSNVFVFNLAFVGFTLWNILTTYWIYFSTLFGVILAILLNALFYSIVFVLFHITKNKLGKGIGYLSLIAYWITFEYLHLDWDLSWPWLVLGNGFSTTITWIQWYEFTGVFGGSLWILVTNILLFQWINKSFIEKTNKPFRSSWLYGTLGLIIVPIILSNIIFKTYEEVKSPVKVVVVQPNIDPYDEKFTGMSPEEQMHRIITLAKKKTDSTTQFIVAPETAISQGLWEEKIHESWSIDSLKKIIRQYPNIRIVCGASTHKEFRPGEPLSPTARKFKGEEIYYDAYNAAIQINKDNNIEIYHKSKLVPGVEIMPYSKYLKFLEKYALDLGGTVGSLGTQPNRTPFDAKNSAVKVAPVICYESIYGEYVSKYVKNGANLIFIMTNDGWWSNTAGYKQHSSYASLRAIETRRSVARSANTGISSFVNQRGEQSQRTGWWQEAVIKETLNANSKITFYVAHGDYIARIFSYLTIVLIAAIIYLRILRRVRTKKL